MEKMAVITRNIISLTFVNEIERQLTFERTTTSTNHLRIWPPVSMGTSIIWMRSWILQHSLESLDFAVGGVVVMEIEVTNDHKMTWEAEYIDRRLWNSSKNIPVNKIVWGEACIVQLKHFVFPVGGGLYGCTTETDKLSQKRWISTAPN